MFTLKMLGALIVGTGVALYGFGISREITEKNRVQRALIKVLYELERGISAKRTICEIFSCYTNDNTCEEIPPKLQKALCEKSEKPLYNALKQYDGINLLEHTLRNELFDFAIHLGTYGNIDEEIGCCRKVRRLVEERKNECEPADKQRAELTAKLGVLAAGAIVIIVGL